MARSDVFNTERDIQGRAGPISAHLRSLAESCPGRNDWVCGPALRAARPDLVAGLAEHAVLAAAAVAGAVVVALPVVLLTRRLRPVRALGRGAGGVLAALPLLALVAGTVALTGRSALAVVLPVGLTCTVLLVQALAAGLAAVPAAVVESARAAGFAGAALLVRVELRTALPQLVGGLRSAVAAAVSLTTAGAVLGHGGLGDVLVRGVREGARTEVLAAAALVVLLALVPDLVLRALQRRAAPRARARVPVAA
ncbi:ABC transporter permease subunit [Kineococcus rubinsiae]|uniref:ABC transporter permease subunit n=1 Tax=Kineococcus rubinsiae TaxID=2609562 RepID=UPI00142F44A6|nr:ABC transporter permease subunit [Kineococcus rubinsiae]NIZ92072.1 ABC transporter permease subunit [Kineococcus rubinsiae]